MPDKTKKQRQNAPVAEQEFDVGEDGLTFSLRYADHGYRGAWAWPRGAATEEVFSFLCHVGALTWDEIAGQLFSTKRGSHRKHHSQHVDTLCPEARRRIEALKCKQRFGEKIFRFRVGGRKRLWGFKRDGVFYILWWDAEHRVYPAEAR
ncbi:hypothetical protein [Actinoplanes sp. RD1]|uniref:hypothetical protein n=1 Tax=Actinoplanes sp. RD1 TaxID=3064538 RepID=UPI0027405080|nr:hypothetical protein [Actinoplanes sp. RD1]